MAFFKAFDNHLINDPYKTAFAHGDHTYAVADFLVTIKTPLPVADGKMEFCTVATWKDGEIVEERSFYDVVGMMNQLGLLQVAILGGSVPSNPFRDGSSLLLLHVLAGAP